MSGCTAAATRAAHLGARLVVAEVVADLVDGAAEHVLAERFREQRRSIRTEHVLREIREAALRRDRAQRLVAERAVGRIVAKEVAVERDRN